VNVLCSPLLVASLHSAVEVLMSTLHHCSLQASNERGNSAAGQVRARPGHEHLQADGVVQTAHQEGAGGHVQRARAVAGGDCLVEYRKFSATSCSLCSRVLTLRFPPPYSSQLHPLVPKLPPPYPHSHSHYPHSQLHPLVPNLPPLSPCSCCTRTLCWSRFTTSGRRFFCTVILPRWDPGGDSGLGW
jgi:hypothetical protein